jgi:hypothetical protein
MTMVQMQMAGEQAGRGGTADGTASGVREDAGTGPETEGATERATTVRPGRSRGRAALEAWLRRVDALLQGQAPADGAPEPGRPED